MEFEEMLANLGGFRNLFATMRKSGMNVEKEVEDFLRKESGLFESVGFKVDKLGDGLAQLSFPYSQRIARRGGIVHGGVMIYAMDNVGGLCVMTQSHGVDQLTLELKVNFIQPLRKEPFTAIGKTVRVGGTTAVAEVEVRDGDQKTCAKGLGTWFIIKQKS
jgi:uncharacterized protein (TIGR00369 family)